MTASFVLLLMMVGFLAGVIIGELRDQRDAEREARDLAEAEDWLACLRNAFADEAVERAA